MLVTLAIGVGLRLFFNRARMGIALRAVVDSPSLLSMSGTPPVRVAQVSWALGTFLAALAGILLAPIEQLNITVLTLVIINAFAAAIFGRLKNLTLTVVGALTLGLAVNYAIEFLPPTNTSSEIENAIPMMLLFVALVFLGRDRLRSGVLSGLQVPRVPSGRQSAIFSVGLVLLAIVLSQVLSPVNLATASEGLVYGLILLSLVPLTGYAGQLSLGQMTFVGIGAYAMSQAGSRGSLLGVLAAAGMAAAFGGAVAIPTIRLRGIYLALATLAFAAAMDSLFFNQVFGAYGGALSVARVHIPGVPTQSNQSFFILLAVVFALVASGVLAVRRSRWGRRLAALNDSPAACSTLGVNILWTKLAVFMVSAGVAGVAGVFYGGLQHQIDSGDFQVFNSLTLVLLLLIGGRNTVSGALLGAVSFALFPVLQSHIQSLSNLQYLLTGLAAVSIGINQNGIGGQIASLGERLRSAWHPAGAKAVAAP